MVVACCLLVVSLIGIVLLRGSLLCVVCSSLCFIRCCRLYVIGCALLFHCVGPRLSVVCCLLVVCCWLCVVG